MPNKKDPDLKNCATDLREDTARMAMVSDHREKSAAFRYAVMIISGLAALASVFLSLVYGGVPWMSDNYIKASALTGNSAFDLFTFRLPDELSAWFVDQGTGPGFLDRLPRSPTT